MDSETFLVGYGGSARKDAGQPRGSLSSPTLEEVADIMDRSLEGNSITAS